MPHNDFIWVFIVCQSMHLGKGKHICSGIPILPQTDTCFFKWKTQKCLVFVFFLLKVCAFVVELIVVVFCVCFCVCVCVCVFFFFFFFWWGGGLKSGIISIPFDDGSKPKPSIRPH